MLIGVLDWGFDYTHPNFYDTTLTSTRIRGAWDQYRQSGPAPAGFEYGTVAETPADLMAMGSDTANVYSYSTHGTHVAGISGGSGCGIGLHGMAPAAEFLLATLMVDEASALDAFAWMQDVAEADNKRLVINNSWGLPQWGTPDGTSLSNQFIDAMSDEGVVFGTSNGNNGDSNFHFDHTFTAPGDTARSLVTFYPLSSNPNAWGQSLHLWGSRRGLSREPGLPRRRLQPGRQHPWASPRTGLRCGKTNSWSTGTTPSSTMWSWSKATRPMGAPSSRSACTKANRWSMWSSKPRHRPGASTRGTTPT